VIGERIVGEVEFLREIMPFIRHHHERFDGMGYPDGLAGEAIPLEARIIFIAEAFDCLMSAGILKKSLGRWRGGPGLNLTHISWASSWIMSTDPP
jgi:HD-GYP domain-containing protein (c-di-GMP phosphodiesterase class II)